MGIEKVYGVFCISKAATAIWIAKLDMNVYPLLPPCEDDTMLAAKLVFGTTNLILKLNFRLY